MSRHGAIWLMGALALHPGIAQAETIATNSSENTLWFASGFTSYHFQTDQHLRNDNLGAGLEYRYSNNSSVMAGRFNNSDWQVTRYAAWLYQPLSVGYARLGFAVGVFDGYPKINNGRNFAAVVPLLGVEYKNLGANMTFVPTFHNRLHGSVSLQVKFKLL